MEPVVDLTKKDTARQWATSAINAAGRATSHQFAGPKTREMAADKDEVVKEATKEVEAEVALEVEPRDPEEERKRRRKRRIRSYGST